MRLLRWLKAVVKGGGDEDIDAIRADQAATLTYGVPPEQAERIAKADAEDLEEAERE